jgi:hypothetical protein
MSPGGLDSVATGFASVDGAAWTDFVVLVAVAVAPGAALSGAVLDDEVLVADALLAEAAEAPPDPAPEEQAAAIATSSPTTVALPASRRVPASPPADRDGSERRGTETSIPQR